MNIELIILITPVILFSLTVHEYSHGRIALLLGDDTAQRLGRLSFNPIRHLDMVGMLFIYFVGFGWAKPVPVDPRNFVSPRRDMMYVAIAGPLSNIALAVVCSFFIRVLSPQESIYLSYLFIALIYGLIINMSLAIFNMLPMFPLDGASVLKGIVSHDVAEKIANLDRYMAFLLLGVFLLDHFADAGIFKMILSTPIKYSIQLLTQEKYRWVEPFLW